jgi:hypothetical protein
MSKASRICKTNYASCKVGGHQVVAVSVGLPITFGNLPVPWPWRKPSATSLASKKDSGSFRATLSGHHLRRLPRAWGALDAKHARFARSQVLKH